MSLKEQELYEFGDFRLDVSEHRLARFSGAQVQLSDKAFEVLCVLVRNAGHLVEKSDLLNQVWAGSFVEENNLNKCIHAIRRGLGEKPGKHQFVETVPKHGFRFIAEVRTLEPQPQGAFHAADDSILSATYINSTTEPPEETSGIVFDLPESRTNGQNGASQKAIAFPVAESQPAVTPASKSSRLIWATVAVLMLGSITLGYYLYSASSTTLAGQKSIAVLPLKPIDANNRDNLYEVGVADAIISSLSQVQGFEVRSLNAVRDYNSINQDPVIAGREQKVDYVLAPSYQLAGGRIRITAPLINVASGKVEDTLKFEKEAASHFAVQDAVAASFGSDLMRRFARTGSGPPAKRGTDNEQAYQLYQQAIYLHDKKRSREALSKAVEYLEQAVSLDPNYAEAWAGKALAHASAYGYGSNSDQEYQRSMEAVSKAHAIDPNLSEPYSALCQNKFSYEYDFAGAEAACKRAIELDPNSSIAHQIYSHFLGARNRREEAFTEIKTAIDLDPASYFNQRFYANCLYAARRYDEAIAQYKKQIELNPTNIGTYNWIIRALEAQGNEPEAFELFIRSLTLQEGDQKTIQRFRDAYRNLGWRGVLLERIKTPEVDRGSSSDFRLAGLYARVGNKDKAFEYLEKSYLQREVVFTMLQTEPQIDSIRDDPRYADLVRRVEGH